MPSAADWQDSILREVGAGLEGLPDEVLARVLDKVTPYLSTYWEMWAWKSLIYPSLQALYVKRQCLLVLLGQTRDLINVTIGSGSIQQATLNSILQTLYKTTQDEIQRVEEIARSSRPPVLAPLTANVVQDALGRVFRTDVPGQRNLPPPSGLGW